MRKRLVEHGQVADDDGEESEPDSRLGDRQKPSQRAHRRDVTKAEREERNSAKIEIIGKAGFFPRSAEFRAERPLQAGQS